MAAHYHSVSEKLKKEYGRKIYRLSLSSGCSCPNRDGKLSYGGCTFCSEGGSGDFAAPFAPLDEQIEKAKKRVAGKLGKKALPEAEGINNQSKQREEKYIAYFQPYTNTYGDTKRLKELYSEAVNREDIVILSVATRPDCLEDDKLEMLSELNKIKPVWVELGLQTIHESTAERINRGYSLPVFEDAYRRLKEAGIEVIIHVILGLPGESREDMLDTVRYISALRPVPDGVKLQLLHILEGTKLADEYKKEAFHVMELEEYAELIVDCIKILPEETVLHRITGDAPKRLLIEPKWSGDKKRVLNYMMKRIREVFF